MGETDTPPAMPYDERDDESGQFTQSFTDEEFINVVRERDLPTTSEIADAVGCKYRTAYDRLGQLADDGVLERKEVGNSLVWLIPDSE